MIYPLVVCLKDISDDVEESITTLKELDIKYIAINDTKDHLQCKKLKTIIEANDLNPITYDYQFQHLPNTHEALESIYKAEYFKCKFIKLDIPNNCDIQSITDCVSKSYAPLLRNSLPSELTLVMNIKANSALSKPSDILKFARDFNIKLCYNPGLLVLKQKTSPFDKYYSALQKHISIIEIQDHKTGFGNIPAGYGDARILEAIKASKDSRCWYALKPGLGSKYGGKFTKKEVFKLAYESLEDLLKTWN